MKIAFGGDVFLGGDLGHVDLIENPIGVAAFNNADLRVVNLEQAVSSESGAADKGTLYTEDKSLEWLDAMSVDVVGVANNHVHDKGEHGVVETVAAVAARGIGVIGAGSDAYQAAAPYALSESIYLIAYCDYGRSYLRHVLVANDGRAGINPLRWERIEQDLESLPTGSQAVLYLHWGREHMWFPPAHDLRLARRLLADERVALVIGMHPHRPQGYIQHNGKRAYFCVGNFLFPNFCMIPPAQLDNDRTEADCEAVTRTYQKVYRPTYKRWRSVNRISMVVTFNTVDGATGHQFTWQQDDAPMVVDLCGWRLTLIQLWVNALSSVYLLPLRVYKPIEYASSGALRVKWRLDVYEQWRSQLGTTEFLRRASRKIARRVISRRVEAVRLRSMR